MFRSEALKTISLHIQRFPTLKQLSMLKVIETMGDDKTKIKELDIPVKLKSDLLNVNEVGFQIRTMKMNDSELVIYYLKQHPGAPPY